MNGKQRRGLRQRPGLHGLFACAVAAAWYWIVTGNPVVGAIVGIGCGTGAYGISRGPLGVGVSSRVNEFYDAPLTRDTRPSTPEELASGRCRVCDGVGWTWQAVGSRGGGGRHRCPRCDGTGQPPLPASTTSDE